MKSLYRFFLKLWRGVLAFFYRVAVTIVAFLLIVVFLVIVVKVWDRGEGYEAPDFSLKNSRTVVLDMASMLSPPWYRAVVEGEQFLLGEGIFYTLRELEDLPFITTVILDFSRFPLSLVMAEEIRNHVEALNLAGKTTIAFSESYDMKTLLASSTCQQRLISPMSFSSLLRGTVLSVSYNRGLMDKLRIRPYVFSTDPYKTAANTVEYKTMPEADREVFTSIVKDLNSSIFASLEGSMDFPAKTLRTLLSTQKPFYSGEELLQQGLVTKVQSFEDLEKEMGKVSIIGSYEEFRQESEKFMETFAYTQIGELYLQGGIGDREADIFIEELKSAENNASIRGMLVYLNSPGGGFESSRRIYEAVRKAKKPIVVLLRDMGTSGGYYAVAAADKIVAYSSTITGSIGVFMALPMVKESLEVIGINTYNVSEFPDDKTALFLTEPLSEGQQGGLEQYVEKLYDIFIEDVAKGREVTKAEINQVGRGRVWTGSQALEQHLVDSLGGIEVALTHLKVLCGIPADERVNLVKITKKRKREIASRLGLLFSKLFVKTFWSIEEQELLYRSPIINIH